MRFVQAELSGKGLTNRIAIASLKNLGPNTRRGIQRAFYDTGKDLVGHFNREVLAKNKTGRLYIVRSKSGSRRSHIASAAGETPGNVTGFYRKSIDYRATPKQLVFGNSAPYAGYLERGTSRMSKRPGLGNAVKDGERDIIRNLTTRIEENL